MAIIRIHWWRASVLATLVLFAGCAEDLASLSDPTDNVELGAPVLFAEDSDPAVAALPFVADELLVQPFPGADAQAVSALFTSVGAIVIDELTDIDVTVLRVPADQFIAIAEQLADSGLIETVQKNYWLQAEAIPDDELFSRQHHLAQVDAPEAWDVTTGDESIVVAVVDTGVDPNHPDLAARIVDGWNVFNNDDDFDDVVGHGTRVAGVLAAATNNGEGIAGITWDNPLLAVRVGDDQGRASARHIAAGILWALRNGAKVINVSFAPLWSNRIVKAAAQHAFNQGSLVIISSGNGGTTSTSKGYREALFVSAVDRSDRFAAFSDHGPFVDLSAPGVAIRTTERGGAYGLPSGTSFAAPIVAGAAALAWSVNPQLRPISIQEALFAGAVDLGEVGKDDRYGHGAINVADAVAAAAAAIVESDTTPPAVSITQPRSGATLSRRFTAKVTATDRWGVADVVMSIDGIAIATDTRASYRFSIDPANFETGRHTISFVATDFSGNASTAKTVSVTFGRRNSGSTGSASTIRFTSPVDGARVSGNVTIEASVSDTDGLATVEWFVDGVSVFATPVGGRSTSVSFLWRTVDVEPGAHTITLVVTDAGGSQTSARLDLTRR